MSFAFLVNSVEGRNLSGDNESDLPPLAERRPIARKKVLFSAVAVQEFGRNTIACQVRDISAKGAKIAVSRNVDLPRDLHLIIVRDYTAYRAQLVWRKADEAGLAFIEALDLRANADSALSRIWARHKTAFLSWR